MCRSVKVMSHKVFFLACLTVGCRTTVDTNVAVGPQYDSTHVYVAPADVDRFVKSVLATFGGTTTNQVVTTVTPTPSRTTSQLVQTPVGIVSVFGFLTPTRLRSEGSAQDTW
jgi:hypothetical protein